MEGRSKKERELGSQDVSRAMDNITKYNMPDDMEDVDPKAWKRAVREAEQVLKYIEALEEKLKSIPADSSPKTFSNQDAMDMILDSTPEEWKKDLSGYKVAAEQITKK